MKTVTGMAIGFTLLMSTSALAATTFTVSPLVSDQAGRAPNVDPDLKNPWGISQFPNGDLWVSDNHTGVSTIYDAVTGVKNSLVVSTPGEKKNRKGRPTGQVAMPSGNGFVVTGAGGSGESVFIFATEDGQIEGWSPSVDLHNAIVAYQSNDDGGHHGGDDGAGRKKNEDAAHYTGLTWDSVSNHLFAANLTGKSVDVFDNTFAKIASFTDSNLPKGYAPFNVAVLNGELYVAFAKVKKGDDDATEGKGLGYVDVFSTTGVLQNTIVANGPLNAPWGLVIAPSNFGSFAGSLLVGNFGDGHVNAFDAGSGALIGTLSTGSKSVQIEGLWQLDDTLDGSVTFSAGPKDEKHGLIGRITPQ
ncbi:MAG: TIGR03118 family protein [Rhizomicrobium sp.]